MNCLIVLSGSISLYRFQRSFFDEYNYIICADGGAEYLKANNIVPDALLGDFDSINEQTLAFYHDKKVKLIRYPCNKDYTDGELAINLAIEMNADFVTIIGALGNRFDHSLANVFMLQTLCDKGIVARMVDDYNEIYITKSSIEIDKTKDMKISLIPITEVVRGVSTMGLCYELNGQDLYRNKSFGVSNEFSEDKALITIEEGVLLIIKSKD